MHTGAIWLIDPDLDDREIVMEVCKELNIPNNLVFLNNAEEALHCLANVARAPFLIICELNLSGTNGLMLRREILRHDSKKFKTVPFIFWTTDVSESQIMEAYDLSAHGLFIKDSKFGDFKKTFTYILQYWTKSRMPEKSDDGHL